MHCRVVRERMGWCPHRPCPSLPEKAQSTASASTERDKVLHGIERLEKTVIAFLNYKNHHSKKMKLIAGLLRGKTD